MLSGQIDAIKVVPSVYTCISCRVKFETTELQRAHFKSEWHQYNLKRKVCNLPAIDLPSFEEIAAHRPISEKKDTSERDRHAPSSSKDEIEEIDTNDDDETLDDEEWDDCDDYEEEAEMLARVIKDDTCLFCNKHSSNIHDNVTHMNSYHGFFIPEEQYLIDLEGFMEYLGFKVGAGATCLWCNKEFTTTDGARLHMMYKDHCKIDYTQDKALEEFKEFYDYTDQQHFDMKPLSQLVVSKSSFNRRTDHSRSLAKTGQLASHKSNMNHNALIKRSGPEIKTTVLVRKFKKFDAVRAKKLLKIGMGNNETMRSRMRLQNPM